MNKSPPLHRPAILIFQARPSPISGNIQFFDKTIIFSEINAYKLAHGIEKI